MKRLLTICISIIISIAFISCSVTEPAVIMVSIAGGTYTMGYDGFAEPKHEVTLSSFSIGKYEVTYELWEVVRLWALNNGYRFGSNGEKGYGSGTTMLHPVVYVDWYDAVVWCNALSEKQGFTPVYYTENSHTNVYRDSSIHIDIENSWVKWNANGYRLPTEAEWEYAARNKGERQGDQYSGSSIIDDVAWYYSNAGSSTHEVGTKQANELGIYDMSGSVWEWCWDWYAVYSSSAETDPHGPSSKPSPNSFRVARGGSWLNYAYYLSCSRRRYDHRRDISSYLGFRLLRTP